MRSKIRINEEIKFEDDCVGKADWLCTPSDDKLQKIGMAAPSAMVDQQPVGADISRPRWENIAWD